MRLRRLQRTGMTIISHLKVTTRMQSHNSLPTLKLWLSLSENCKSRTLPSLHFPSKINEEPRGMAGSAVSLRLPCYLPSEHSTGYSHRRSSVAEKNWQWWYVHTNTTTSLPHTESSFKMLFLKRYIIYGHISVL